MYHDYWILQCSDKEIFGKGLGNFMKSISIIESTRQTYSPETGLSDRKFKRLIFIFYFNHIKWPEIRSKKCRHLPQSFAYSIINIIFDELLEAANLNKVVIK